MLNRLFSIPSLRRKTLASWLLLGGLASGGVCLPAGDALAQSPNAASKAGDKPAADPLPEAGYLDKETIGIGVLRMDRIRKTSLYLALLKTGALKEAERAMQEIGVELADLERVTVAVDQTVVDLAARQVGLSVPMETAAEFPPWEMNNKGKQIALAFHNYESAYRRLPRANGNGEGNKIGLSWRVHLLPYLDESPLYREFHLDEPWDSEHNKPLIAKMPKLFRSPGVEEPGKTTFHVFTGKGTLFDGDRGKTFADIKDGMSNTLLAFCAAPETATEWTRPGGLEFDPKTCRELLGKTDGEGFYAVMVDGAARQIPSKITAENLALWIQIGDGQVVQLPPPQRSMAVARPAPTMILTFSKPYRRPPAERLPKPEAIQGDEMYEFPHYSVSFASDKLIVMSPAATLRRMIQNRQAKAPTASSMLPLLPAEADSALAFDLGPQAKLMQEVLRRHPLVEVFQPVTSLTLQLNISQPEGGTLLELAAITPDAAAAEGLVEALTPGLDQVKASVSKLPIPTPTPVAEKGKTLGLAAIAAATLKPDKERVVLRVPVPEGFSKAHELIAGATSARDEEAQAVQKRKDRLKELGLAFHNYESTWGNFPGAGRSTASRKAGLSWRVHILPYIGHARLYNEFNTDQPWDSEKNKKLIEKMPAFFKTPGVEKPNHTSLHVFTGKGAPFADDRAPKLADFTDGTSNTLLVVEAGPDKAEIWTKPGGLDFDPEKPIDALGKFEGNGFQAVLADGSVKLIGRSIDARILRLLIEHQDGEPLNLP